MHKPEGYKELIVYKRAEELRLYVQKLTQKLPFSEKRRKVHLNDSARSVKQNIVEGWKRSTTKEYYDFLSFSLGSLAEIKEDIKDLNQDKIISEKVKEFFYSKCREIDYLLNQLKKSLYAKMQREGNLPLKEKYRQIQTSQNQTLNELDKLIEEMGLERQPDGRYIQK